MATEEELAEAEKYFKAYDCTVFYMWHDDPRRYSWYKALKIPDEVEQKWTQDVLELAMPIVKAMDMSGEIWKSHSRLIRVAGRLEPKQKVDVVLECTHSILDKLPDSLSNIIVAQNLIGRSGILTHCIIGEACEEGLTDQAQQFVDIAIKLLKKAEKLGSQLERSDSARLRLEKLATRLGLACERLDETTHEVLVYVVGPSDEQKLIDPTAEQVNSSIDSLNWKKGQSITLQRLPYEQTEIDWINIEWPVVVEQSEDSLILDVSWRGYPAEPNLEQKDDDGFLPAIKQDWQQNRATVHTVEDVRKILDAALCNDVDRLRNAVDWN